MNIDSVPWVTGKIHYSKSMLRTISNLNVLKTRETTEEESNGDVVITYLNISLLLEKGWELEKWQ